MATIQVDQKACIRCGACVDICFAAAVFELTGDGSSAVRPEECWHCGQCVAVCPTDAIDHDGFPLEECPMIDEKRLPAMEELTLTFRSRRSCRTFEDKPVPREVVRDLVNLGRWAPTASNRQALDWIAYDDRDRIAELADGVISEFRRFARLAGNPILRPFISLAIGRDAARQLRRSKRAFERLLRRHAAGEDPIFYNAPVVLLGHCPSGSTFGRDDAIYATYNVMLAAERLGLGTCQIGFFQAAFEKSARLRRKVAIPEGRKPQVAVALGYARHTFRRVLPRRSPNLSWNPR
jgi:nitroreductase/NAD-dependent dihydropyrimidine dehydrogenase PreA subunit